MQVTYPLDVLRLRLAVEPGYMTMSQACSLCLYNYIEKIFRCENKVIV